MTTVCMVVHAEGPGELGDRLWDVPPKETLLPDHQGPAHIIIQRILTEGKQIPEAAIEFREPLRTQTGARAYGSRLLDSRVLDEILIGWLLEPLFIVVLVDSDGSKPTERLEILQNALERNNLQGAVGVAVKEFESWLIADSETLHNILRLPKEQSAIPKPETLDAGAAKRLLIEWSQVSETSQRRAKDIRKEIASSMDLAMVADLCPSFKRFRQEVLKMHI